MPVLCNDFFCFAKSAVLRAVMHKTDFSNVSFLVLMKLTDIFIGVTIQT